MWQMHCHGDDDTNEHLMPTERERERLKTVCKRAETTTQTQTTIHRFKELHTHLSKLGT